MTTELISCCKCGVLCESPQGYDRKKGAYCIDCVNTLEEARYKTLNYSGLNRMGRFPKRFKMDVLDTIPDRASPALISKIIKVNSTTLNHWQRAGLKAEPHDDGTFIIDKSNLIAFLEATGRIKK